jgi:lipoprotein-anchoring transpeptidase ErfK/SrfK
MRPALNVCTGLIDRANGLGGRYLREGQVLRVPTDPVRVEVYLAAHWLLYLLADEVVAAWEVGIGKPGNETQVGTFTVGEKIPEPTWFQPGRAPVPYGDPENPLGTRWIAWEGTDGLGFHGTNEPEGVGGDVSLGCIRMHNEHVEELFEILPRGATVLVRR